MEHVDGFNKILPYLEEAFRIIDASPNRESLRDQIFTYVSSFVLTDDERARRMGLPEGCRIREAAKIISPDQLRCGMHVWIGEGAVLDASGGLEIGDHTSIGLYVLIWSHSSYLTNTKMANYSGSDLITRTQTRIGSGCFLAGHSVVYPGVYVRDRTVLLPMSVVAADTPGNCIMGGSPARVIRELRTDELPDS